MFVGFSIYCNDFGGPKQQSFGNNSVKSRPIRTKFGKHAHIRSRGNKVHEISGAMGLVEQNGGLSTKRDSISSIFQRPIFANFGHDT